MLKLLTIIHLNSLSVLKNTNKKLVRFIILCFFFFLVVVPNHESHVDKSEISNKKKMMDHKMLMVCQSYNLNVAFIFIYEINIPPKKK